MKMKAAEPRKRETEPGVFFGGSSAQNSYKTASYAGCGEGGGRKGQQPMRSAPTLKKNINAHETPNATTHLGPRARGVPQRC